MTHGTLNLNEPFKLKTLGEPPIKTLEETLKRLSYGSFVFLRFNMPHSSTYRSELGRGLSGQSINEGRIQKLLRNLELKIFKDSKTQGE